MADRAPLDCGSGFHVELRPEMSVRQAMTAVYRELLEKMRCNAKGIVEDLDIEHLHDFRVAVRRTRSGLGQMRDALPVRETGKFRREFAWLGHVTGPVRDLDVCLGHEQQYTLLLPESLRSGLTPFFSALRAQRAVERERLIRQLASARYRRLITAWQECLDRSGGESGPSGRPMLDAVREILQRRFRTVIREGKKIHSSSPPEKLHRLRIRCKKLRYLLEFSASLFPREDIGPAIRQLKRLQENLGDFNDRAVQQAILEHHLATLRSGSRADLETAASLGGLLARLHHDQQRVRRQFDRRFREFARPANVGLYGRLIGKQDRSAGTGHRE